MKPNVTFRVEGVSRNARAGFKRRNRRMGVVTPIYLLLILLLISLSAALAQGLEVSGTIEATFGGEALSWNTFGAETANDYQPTASWSLFMDSFATLSIQGHIGSMFSVENALALELSSFSGFPSDCPCTFTDASFMYWTTPDMFDGVYSTKEGQVTLTKVEPLDGDAYRVEGTFRGTLSQLDLMTDTTDPEDSFEIDGSFVIERLLRDD